MTKKLKLWVERLGPNDLHDRVALTRGRDLLGVWKVPRQRQTWVGYASRRLSFPSDVAERNPDAWLGEGVAEGRLYRDGLRVTYEGLEDRRGMLFVPAQFPELEWFPHRAVWPRAIEMPLGSDEDWVDVEIETPDGSDVIGSPAIAELVPVFADGLRGLLFRKLAKRNWR